MPDNILLMIDLRILHARLRETNAHIGDISRRYPLKELAMSADHDLMLHLISDAEKIYDWAYQLKRQIAAEITSGD